MNEKVSEHIKVDAKQNSVPLNVVDIMEVFQPEDGVGYYEIKSMFKGEEPEPHPVKVGNPIGEDQTELVVGMQVSRKNYETLTATQPSRAQQNMRKIEDKKMESINNSMLLESEISQGTVVKPLDTDRKAQSMMTNYNEKETQEHTFGKTSDASKSRAGQKSEIKLLAGTMDMQTIDVGLPKVSVIDSELQFG